MRERELISINERKRERDVRIFWLEMSKFERERQREIEEIRELQRVRDKDMRDRKKMRERKRKNESQREMF